MSSGTAAGAGGAGAGVENPQALVAELNGERRKRQLLMQKLGEMQSEATEHKVVIQSLEKVEPTRKCFRLVGGVLVERTVAEVLPAVKANMEGISKVASSLSAQIEKTDAKLIALQNKLGAASSAREAGSGSAVKATSSGVLVA